LFQIRNLGVVTPVLVGGNAFPLDARAQPPKSALAAALAG
jgi:hypothetical protein